jgi:hypothetical protein
MFKLTINLTNQDGTIILLTLQSVILNHNSAKLTPKSNMHSIPTFKAKTKRWGKKKEVNTNSKMNFIYDE